MIRALWSRFSIALLSAPVIAAAAACGGTSHGRGAATQGSGGSAQPLAGKTINLVSSGAAGSSHDLFARALAPALAKYLHATVHVVDMPGGGQLLAWNYVYGSSPDGLTIGTVDVEGILANLWEKVPNNNVNPAKVTMLGGLAGGTTGESEVMFAANSTNPVFSNVYSLVKDRSVKVRELGSVGDVPGPLLFKLYHVPYTDLTAYSDSSAELQGMIRGDGNVSVKSWAGSWAAYVTGGKGKVLLAFSMRPTWQEDPSVPTVAQLLKKDPISGPGRVAEVADSTALDAGTGIFGPPGMPAATVKALRAAVAYAVSQPSFKSAAVKGSLSTTFESAADETAAIQAGVKPQTIAIMRKYVPLSTGVAS